jgi:hypothetical protein
MRPLCGLDIRALKLEMRASSDADLLDAMDARIPRFSAAVSAHLRDTCRKAFALGGPHYATAEAVYVFSGGALVTVLAPGMKAPRVGARP